MSTATYINDNEFDTLLTSETVFVVDCTASWCGPCKTIAPVLEELATQYSGKVKIVKINVDENKEYATKFNVRGIPNLILFKDGESKEQIVGAVAKQELVTAIDKVV